MMSQMKNINCIFRGDGTRIRASCKDDQIVNTRKAYSSLGNSKLLQKARSPHKTGLSLLCKISPKSSYNLARFS